MFVALSEILSNRSLHGDLVTFHASDDWMQGRTMFGGFLAALALVAMRDTLGIDMPLRVLQTNFVAPVPAGEIVYRTRLLRQGKNVSHVQCDIYSNEVLAGLVVAVFGASRGTTLPALKPEFIPFSREIKDIPSLPFIPKVTPNFLQHIEMRWALGGIPYTGIPSWESGVYIRSLDRSLSPEVLVVMLSDGPPNPCLSHFKGPVMASSVSWSLEFPPMTEHIENDAWFQINMQTTSGAEGYVNQRTQLWTPTGQLASLGHQVVAVFG
jgi:acyl-CoA thioesterase